MISGIGVALPDGGSDGGPNSGIGGVPGAGDLNTTTKTKPLIRCQMLTTLCQICIRFANSHLTVCSGTGVARPDGGSDLGPNSGNGGVRGVGALERNELTALVKYD